MDMSELDELVETPTESQFIAALEDDGPASKRLKRNDVIDQNQTSQNSDDDDVQNQSGTGSQNSDDDDDDADVQNQSGTGSQNSDDDDADVQNQSGTGSQNSDDDDDDADVQNRTGSQNSDDDVVAVGGECDTGRGDIKSTNPKPLIIEACYSNMKVVDGRRGKMRTAQCVQCHQWKRDGLNSTGNWVRHVRLPGHEQSNKKYKNLMKKKKVFISTPITHFFKPNTKYTAKVPRQKRIRAKIVNFIIKTDQALRVVERTTFHELMEELEPKFNQMSRYMVRTDINKKFQIQKNSLKTLLMGTQNISLTIDIWSDRRKRSYLGITIHFLEGSEVSTALLCCQKFEGRHTGDNIKKAVEDVLQEFELVEKVKFIISDNASNMVKAFSVAFTGADQELVDDGEIWCDIEDEAGDSFSVTTLFEEHRITICHLRCFAHSLQLSVKAGIHELRTNPIMAKCSRLTSLLHTSVNYQEVFEAEYGRQGLLQPVPTRWDSVYKHIKSFTKKEYTVLNRICGTAGVNVRFSSKEWDQLEEQFLRPFYEATMKTQGDKVVTISYVVPCIVNLVTHMEGTNTRSVLRVKNELLKDLKARFAGVLGFFAETPSYDKLPYGHDVYFLATLLDPNFGPQFFTWLLTKKMKIHLVDELKEMLSRNIDQLVPEPTGGTQSQQDNTSCSSQDLFADFEESLSTTTTAAVTRSAEVEISLYMSEQRARVEPFVWWRQKESAYNLISQLAKQCLTVPATSAPVERVFSHGGIITRPHRSLMSPALVEELVFLKCNRP